MRNCLKDGSSFTRLRLAEIVEKRRSITVEEMWRCAPKVAAHLLTSFDPEKLPQWEFPTDNYELPGVDQPLDRAKIFEVLLFGSMMTGAARPSDIDMLILDCGILYEKYGGKAYGMHEGHAAQFDLISEELIKEDGNLEVILFDFIFMPLKALFDRRTRSQFMKFQKDKNLLRNTSKQLARYNLHTGFFEATSWEAIKEKYKNERFE